MPFTPAGQAYLDSLYFEPPRANRPIRRRIIEVAGNRVLKCGVVIHVCENEPAAHAYAESLIDDLRYEAERG